MRIWLTLAFVTIFQATAVPVVAGNLALTVDENGQANRILTLAELDQLEQVSFATTTIWTDGNVEFSGVPLIRLLDNLPQSSVLRLTALNDYSVDLPASDLVDIYPIIATRMNGQEISVRDKGPYWLVYPYDSDPVYQNETTYARSIWQLSMIQVMQ